MTSRAKSPVELTCHFCHQPLSETTITGISAWAWDKLKVRDATKQRIFLFCDKCFANKKAFTKITYFLKTTESDYDWQHLQSLIELINIRFLSEVPKPEKKELPEEARAQPPPPPVLSPAPGEKKKQLSGSEAESKPGTSGISSGTPPTEKIMSYEYKDADMAKLLSDLEPVDESKNPYKMTEQHTMPDLIQIIRAVIPENKPILKNEKKIVKFMRENDEYLKSVPEDPVETTGYENMSAWDRIVELDQRLENSYCVLLHNVVPDTDSDEYDKITKICRAILREDVSPLHYERLGDIEAGVTRIVEVQLPAIEQAQRILINTVPNEPLVEGVTVSPCPTEIQEQQKQKLEPELRRRQEAGEHVTIEFVGGEPVIVVKK